MDATHGHVQSPYRQLVKFCQPWQSVLRCEIQYRSIHDMVRFGGQGLAWAGSAWLLGAWDLGPSVGFLRDEVHLARMKRLYVAVRAHYNTYITFSI